MGRQCRPAWQRPLAGAHSLPRRTLHRCPPLELALYSCHRAGLLLQAQQGPRPERFADRAGRISGYRGSRALRYRSWYRESGRLVRTSLCEHPRHELQHRSLHLLGADGCLPHLGTLRNDQSNQQAKDERIVPPLCGFARYSFLWTRLHERTYRYCGFGNHSCCDGSL